MEYISDDLLFFEKDKKIGIKTINNFTNNDEHGNLVGTW